MKYLSKLLILVCSLSSFVGQAGDITNANEIITKANLASYYSADDGSAQARMIIVDAQGNKQMRQFTILRKDQTDLGNQDILVFFSRPTDVQGTVFRVVKKVTSDDDRWLYLPALDLVKRISAGDKRTSFVGAHFFYEDVSGRNPAEDNFTLLKTDNNFYTIKAQPKDLNSVEFDHYIVSVDKNTFLPMQVDFYNSQGKKSRSLQVLKTEVIDGFTTVMHSKITQHSDGSYTEMQFRNVKYNVGLPNDIFSERSLRNPPKEWLD
ncbi:MAG: outer membrane lipoprotein-sorting protein [Colwellia sp.]|jgi:outer membrane lipoprotein-sorting protein|uniref:outer membrane lipoprotein-sorting protein n=1 Tax=unclassified Colwellia TaxID=196834 RepID=UPI0015F76894|nr:MULTISPECIES: outer membrane lipoprotein-sorting protein [unclassified Colwellia]MBA6251157.1 outer membrane lipoprotein-sorting protein [Colwellia sp. MB3u-55]MBA6399546.1 outer membrane lipoprotein-sorting protein [Colwellia sp. BRX10-4]